MLLRSWGRKVQQRQVERSVFSLRQNIIIIITITITIIIIIIIPVPLFLTVANTAIAIYNIISG